VLETPEIPETVETVEAGETALDPIPLEVSVVYLAFGFLF
jgi:hypothetical protein